MPNRFIFVGGSGRSGTSALASFLGSLNHVEALYDIELKLFNESGGILDLYDCFVLNFSFSKCRERLNEFELKYVNWIYDGINFGQPSLEGFFSKDLLSENFLKFKNNLIKPYVRQLQLSEFRFFVEEFLFNVFYSNTSRIYKLEKTPHMILDYHRLNLLFPESVFISVVRDPRSVALSAMKFDWAGGVGALEANIDWVKGYFSAYLTKRDDFLSQKNFLELRLEAGVNNKELISDFFLNNHMDILTSESDFIFESAPDWARGLDDRIQLILNARLSAEVSALGYI